MRIHTDKIDRNDIQVAAANARVGLIEYSHHGSRSRDHAYKVGLTGSSQFRTQWRDSDGGDWQAATWDEWGIFLAHLFEIDPIAHTGKCGYLSAQHFHWVTGDRFRTLTPRQQHKRHRWERRVLFHPDFYPNLLGYDEAWCACGAIQRWVLNGDYWSLLLEKAA